MAFKSEEIRTAIDKVGVFASLLCAVHCIAMPFLLTILPLFGLSILLDTTFEKFFVLFFVILAVLNTCWGYKDHKKNRVLFLSLFGGALLIIANFFFSHSHGGHFHGDHFHEEVVRAQDSSINLTFLVIGAIMVASGHWLNRYFCKQCKDCSDNHC
jgi:hypothetical protein